MTHYFDILASSVPALVVRLVQRQHTPQTTPSIEHSTAAVFFADISGFTTLTERLAQHGADGIEELSLILNAYFGELIDVVMDHGGDIVEFTGDGIIALWLPHVIGEDLRTTVHRAVQCGKTIQHQLHNQTFHNTHITLRVGISVGTVLIATVGGKRGRWELLVAGVPLAHASAAQAQAQPGEVVVSPQVWQLIQTWCSGTALPQPHQSANHTHTLCGLDGIRIDDMFSYLTPCAVPPVPIDDTMVNGLRAYLPSALLARIDAGHTQWVAELRRVTVLFINITGIAFQAADVLNQLQAMMDALQTVLYRYEGSLNQFIVDDKGTLVIAAMGLPPMTHEDDVVRGVLLARAVQEELHRIALQSTIGIATGRIFCGYRGNARRRDYAMIGDVMNLAARLMIHAAPNSILCDATTYLAARNHVIFDALTPIALKGKPHPVHVYRPCHHAPPSVCSLKPLIGREQERTCVQHYITALARTGTGGVVLIEGEAGMGKSHLLNDMLQQAYANNIATYVGQGNAIEQSTPYYIWRAIFSQLLGIVETISEHNTQQQWVVRELIHYDSEIMRLLPLLDVVLPMDIPPNDVTLHMNTQAIANNTRTLLLRVLHIAAQQIPTMIVLDDANWMDATSWTVAIAVCQCIPSLLLVIATRPLNDPLSGVALLRGSLEFELFNKQQPFNRNKPCTPSPSLPHATPMLASEYRHILMHANACHMVLKSLSLAETHTLICHCLHVQQVPNVLVNTIYGKTEGNPLFTQELVFALRDAHNIEIDHHTCRLAPGVTTLETAHLPNTIQGVIISRLDRLPQSQQLLVKVASVIGNKFSFRILYDIYPVKEDIPALLTYLHAIEQHGMMVCVAPPPDRIYQFTHTITRDVVYGTLLFTQRRGLHRAVAEWYEHTYAENERAAYYDILIHHWHKAEEWHIVMHYAECAGQHALHTCANTEAIRFFEQALAISNAHPTAQSHHLPVAVWRARIHRSISEAYLAMGNITESCHHIAQVARLLRQASPHTRRRVWQKLVTHTIMSWKTWWKYRTK